MIPARSQDSLSTMSGADDGGGPASPPKAEPMGPALPAELAHELDDEAFFRLYKENAIQRREGMTLSEDNWEEELEKMPLFMTSQPTKEQIEASPDLQAMQALIEAESTPEKSAKEHGNQIFSEAKKSKEVRKVKFAEYLKAIAAYTSGIDEKCKDNKLNSVLLSNRAAVHMAMGNRRKVINDCEAAAKLNPANIKAYWRACTASLQLEHYAEAIRWADDGLRQDPSNKALVEERQKAVKLKAAVDKKARQKAVAKRKKEAKDAALLKAFQDRGLRFQKPLEVEMDVSLKGIAAAGGEVFVDDQGLLHWPATLMYPEHKQTDFIKDFCEGHTFADHLAHMFGPREQVPWDSDNKYKAGNLSVYFETLPEAEYKKTTLVRVDPRLSLHEAMRDPRYTVVDLTPAFYVLVTGSPFEKQFLATHEFAGAAVDTSSLDASQ